jgi:hypothetical protein
MESSERAFYDFYIPSQYISIGYLPHYVGMNPQSGTRMSGERINNLHYCVQRVFVFKNRFVKAFATTGNYRCVRHSSTGPAKEDPAIRR